MEDPRQQQINALATLTGVLIGILRAKEVITADEQQTLFVFAGSMVPDSSQAFGDKIMNAVRDAAYVVQPG